MNEKLKISSTFNSLFIIYFNSFKTLTNFIVKSINPSGKTMQYLGDTFKNPPSFNGHAIKHC